MTEHKGKIAAALVAVLVLFYAISVYWSMEPARFNVLEAAKADSTERQEKLVVGYTTTTALIKVTETLLDKPGGYLSNDVYFFA